MQGLTEGTRLADRYVLIRRLGEGGMSEVWSARDERADSIVALKRLKPELASREEYRTLFHKEWRIGSRLMHAHIARVFEYHDDAESPFFALQFIDGPNLGILANENLDNALRPFGHLADALRYAHGKSFVHRDVKASNVLLDQNGSPYLLDFGVAAAQSGGSPVNASPGQKAGAAPEPADDVYALGVLLHEIMAGRPPEGDIQAATRAGGEPVPSALQQLLADMLATDASRRPSAEEVAARLKEARICTRAGPSAGWHSVDGSGYSASGACRAVRASATASGRTGRPQQCAVPANPGRFRDDSVCWSWRAAAAVCGRAVHFAQSRKRTR